VTNVALHEAADALRRHEQKGKRLNPWHHISHAQRKRWVEKAEIVLSVYNARLAKMTAENS